MQTNKRVLMMMAAVGIGLSAGWLLPAQQAAGPRWKDKESDLYYKDYPAAKDDKGRLAVLDRWEKGYADSELWLVRDELYLGVYDSMKDYRKLVDKSKAVRAKLPEHYLATVHLALKIPLLPQPTKADIDLAEQVGRQLMDTPDKFKPAAMPAADWDKARPDVIGLARQAVLWSVGKQNDKGKLEAEYRRAVKDEPNQPGYSLSLGQTMYDPKNTAKHPEVIFHWARAAAFEGKNALPAAQKAQWDKSVKQLYVAYHGSDEGLDKVIVLAKNNLFPPADYKIETRAAIAQKEADEKQAWNDAHPIQAWWRDVLKADLTGPTGATAFGDYEDTLLPAESMGFTHFKGKIISMTPVDAPKEVVVAVFDPNVADAKLVFAEAQMASQGVGEEIEFKGSPQAFMKEPFLVTFDMDKYDGTGIVGWTSAAPASTAKPKGAPKGRGGPKGSGGVKGKAVR